MGQMPSKLKPVASSQSLAPSRVGIGRLNESYCLGLSPGEQGVRGGKWQPSSNGVRFEGIQGMKTVSLNSKIFLEQIKINLRTQFGQVFDRRTEIQSMFNKKICFCE